MVSSAELRPTSTFHLSTCLLFHHTRITHFITSNILLYSIAQLTRYLHYNSQPDSLLDHLLPVSASCPRHTPPPESQQQHPLPAKLRRQANRSAPSAPTHFHDIDNMGGGNQDRSHGSQTPLFAEKPVGVPKTSILKGRIEPFYRSGQYDKVNLLA